MKLRCSQCDHAGEKNDFLVPSDIMPPNICKCPNCGQTNEDFYIHREIQTTDEALENIGMKILGKRGASNRMWVERLKLWEDKDPLVVRERTLMEIFDIVQSYRGSVTSASGDKK